MRRRYLWVALLLFAISCPAASGQQIQSMKLLTSQVGWVSTNQTLFWTADGGANWKDITPKLKHKWQAVSSVYFLDVSRGWVVLSCADHLGSKNERLDDTCFEIASTTDAGGNWSVVHPEIVDPDAESGFSGRSFLDFSDPIHGRIILKISKGLVASSGVMLKTQDGGRTWESAPSPPIADHFHFVTPQDGWLAGGPDLELYSTRDGGESWQSVKAAQGSGANSAYSYDLPSFTDTKSGLLAVTVSGAMAPKLSIILFSTDDGGHSWKPSSTLKDLPNIGYVYPTAIWDSMAIAVSTDKTHITMRSARPWQGSTSRTSVTEFDASGLQQLTFASPSQGWVLVNVGLLSTSDGGSHWSELTGPLRGGAPVGRAAAPVQVAHVRV
jgi:photosystem II stability/assembly factor-like uncharacterized protein